MKAGYFLGVVARGGFFASLIPVIGFSCPFRATYSNKHLKIGRLLQRKAKSSSNHPFFQVLLLAINISERVSDDKNRLQRLLTSRTRKNPAVFVGAPNTSTYIFRGGKKNPVKPIYCTKWA